MLVRNAFKPFYSTIYEQVKIKTRANFYIIFDVIEDLFPYHFPYRSIAFFQYSYNIDQHLISYALNLDSQLRLNLVILLVIIFYFCLFK